MVKVSPNLAPMVILVKRLKFEKIPISWCLGDVSQNYNSGNYAGGYNGAYNGGYNGGYNQGAYNPAQPPAGLGQVPAGVDPHSCPNYPFCH